MTVWTDGRRHTLSASEQETWKRIKKPMKCGLCDREFKLGDEYRWVYCNHDERSTGNFFVCVACDGDDVKARRLALYDEFVRLDRIFGIRARVGD